MEYKMKSKSETWFCWKWDTSAEEISKRILGLLSKYSLYFPSYRVPLSKRKKDKNSRLCVALITLTKIFLFYASGAHYLVPRLLPSLRILSCYSSRHSTCSSSRTFTIHIVHCTTFCSVFYSGCGYHVLTIQSFSEARVTRLNRKAGSEYIKTLEQWEWMTGGARVLTGQNGIELSGDIIYHKNRSAGRLHGSFKRMN